MKILIDTHVHTVSSGHAYSTLDENARFASENNIKVMAITDHAPAMPGGAHEFYFKNIRILPKYIRGVRVLKGIEANILDYEGNIDFSDDPEVLENLDLVIASFHPPCIEPADIEKITKTVLKVMDNKNVNIIGHPGDDRFPMDYDKVAKKAKENKVLLEVNNSSLRPTSSRIGSRGNLTRMLESCKKYKTPVILGTDAHFHEEVGQFKESIDFLKEVDFPKELIMNFNTNKFMDFIKK